MATHFSKNFNTSVFEKKKNEEENWIILLDALLLHFLGNILKKHEFKPKWFDFILGSFPWFFTNNYSSKIFRRVLDFKKNKYSEDYKLYLSFSGWPAALNGSSHYQLWNYETRIYYSLESCTKFDLVITANNFVWFDNTVYLFRHYFVFKWSVEYIICNLQISIMCNLWLVMYYYGCWI